jgi:DmsE family decaheme c-type cytochrome
MALRSVSGPVILAFVVVPAAWMSFAAAAQMPPSAPVAAASAAPAPDAGTTEVEDCRACHEPVLNGMRGTYHLGLERQCASCHGDTAAHLKSVTESGEPGAIVSFKRLKPKEASAACLECHDKGRQANWHGSLHDRRGVSCTQCLSVHSFRSVKAQLKTAREVDTCFTCHTNIRAKSLRTSHHPMREGVMGCASCHDPHDGTRPKMVSAEWVNEKCLECHTEKRGPFLWEHAPVRENCLNCHDPHGSNAPSGPYLGR